jgi:hypothetical protein
VEGWKGGRVEGWKGGRVEGWKGGSADSSDYSLRSNKKLRKRRVSKCYRPKKVP